MQLAFSGMSGGMPVEPGDQPLDEAQGHEGKRLQQQRPLIAQLLLLARLRARNRRDLARDSLERAAHVMFVTCKNWFSLGRDVVVKAPVPAATQAEKNSGQTNPVNPANADPASATTLTESPHAHRHD